MKTDIVSKFDIAAVLKRLPVDVLSPYFHCVRLYHQRDIKKKMEKNEKLMYSSVKNRSKVDPCDKVLEEPRKVVIFDVFWYVL